MPKQLNLFSDIECDHCGSNSPSPRNPHLWDGFFDQDTKQYVCRACYAEHYKKKNKTKHKNLYSEIPVPL